MHQFSKSSLCTQLPHHPFLTVEMIEPSLEYLFKQFTSKGGRTVRSSVQHISQVLDGAYSKIPGKSPDAVVVCLGLGARSLGGVEDKTVYPIRGQTVLINAPWVRFGRTISSSDGLWTYIIPRRSGGVSGFFLLRIRIRCIMPFK